MKKEIQAIFFDIDDTLYCTSKFANKAHINALQGMIDMGLNIPLEDLYQELKEIVSEFTSNYSRHFDKLLLRVPKDAYKGINKALLIANAVLNYHNTKYTDLKPYPDAIKLLQHLKKYKITKGIITAGLEIKQAEKILRLELYKYLSKKAIFITEQIGISKPNPKLYKYACKACEVNPENTIYVGDHPTKDIDPSNKIGMITVRIRRDGKYKNLEGETKPNYEISNYDELAKILEENFQFE